MADMDSMSSEKTVVSKPPSVYSHREKSPSDDFDHHVASAWARPVPPPLLTASSSSFSLASKTKVIKYGSGKHANVELVPQPSDEDSDPLNWPRWRRDLNLVSLLFTAGLVGGMKTVFVSTGGTMVVDFGVSYTAVAALTAVPLFLSALTGLTSCIVAKFCGKRPVYLVSAVLLLIGCAWNTRVGHDYSACMGARVFQGLGWGAFDTLLIGSIQDTYFEHERNTPVSLYNLFTLATTWGSPLLGGLASHKAGSFVTQFQIMSGLFALALPLLALGAPETAFERCTTTSLTSGSGATPLRSPDVGFNLHPGRRRWRLRHWTDRDTIVGYLGKMKPVSFHSPMSLSTLLEAPRALVAPTTGLLAALSLMPYSTLWAIALSLALLVTPPPLSLAPPRIGVLMAGPWILGSAVVGACCFYRGFHDRFTRQISYTIVAAGSFLVLIGLLSFGLGLYNFMATQPTSAPLQLLRLFSPNAAAQLSPALLSFQLGVLAAGLCLLDTATRPVLARSASFTSPRIAIAHRSIGDMSAAVVIIRSLVASALVVAMPSLIGSASALKQAAIGFAATHTLIALGIVLLWRFAEKAIWRADGRIMGLVDLRMFKSTTSFFDYS